MASVAHLEGSKSRTLISLPFTFLVKSFCENFLFKNNDHDDDEAEVFTLRKLHASVLQLDSSTVQLHLSLSLRNEKSTVLRKDCQSLLALLLPSTHSFYLHGPSSPSLSHLFLYFLSAILFLTVRFSKFRSLMMN